MKIAAKCSATLRFSYKVHVRVCDPIPLINWATLSKDMFNEQKPATSTIRSN